jgi:hypothetical protein
MLDIEWCILFDVLRAVKEFSFAVALKVIGLNILGITGTFRSKMRLFAT